MNNSDNSIEILLTAARSIAVQDRPEVGIIIWQLACKVVQLQADLERLSGELSSAELELERRPFREWAHKAAGFSRVRSSDLIP